MTDAKNITQKDFDKTTLKHLGLTILECVSNNNALLKTMESVLLKLKESSPIPFQHLRIDSQKHKFIVEQFHVLKEPSYLIFFDGKFIDRLDGIISFKDFSNRINQHIASFKIDNN